jgi:hypothetical protein
MGETPAKLTSYKAAAIARALYDCPHRLVGVDYFFWPFFAAPMTPKTSLCCA